MRYQNFDNNFNSQKKANITLIPKGGDKSLLKIISKILANKLKPLIPNLLSNIQYCVDGKTITSCNTQIRDTLYYYGRNKSMGAIINLDWKKPLIGYIDIFYLTLQKKKRVSKFYH